MGRTRPLLLIAVAVIGFAIGCRKTAPAATVPPEVYVTNVIQKDVPEYLELAGQTQGFQDVDIRANVEGFLESLNFREGSFVRDGDLLYRIDPKPLEASAIAGVLLDAGAQRRSTIPRARLLPSDMSHEWADMSTRNRRRLV